MYDGSSADVCKIRVLSSYAYCKGKQRANEPVQAGSWVTCNAMLATRAIKLYIYL
jgi:hypothetical protein